MKKVGTVEGSAHSSPSSTHSRKPGSGRPIEPGRTGGPIGIPVRAPVSVWP